MRDPGSWKAQPQHSEFDAACCSAERELDSGGEGCEGAKAAATCLRNVMRVTFNDY